MRAGLFPSFAAMPITLTTVERQYVKYHAGKVARGESVLGERERDIVLWIAGRVSRGDSVSLADIKRQCPDCALFSPSVQELRALGKGLAQGAELFALGRQSETQAQAFAAIGSPITRDIGGPAETSGVVYNVPIAGIRPDGRTWQAHVPIFLPWYATLRDLHQLTEEALDATEWSRYHRITVGV